MNNLRGMFSVSTRLRLWLYSFTAFTSMSVVVYWFPASFSVGAIRLFSIFPCATRFHHLTKRGSVVLSRSTILRMEQDLPGYQYLIQQSVLSIPKIFSIQTWNTAVSDIRSSFEFSFFYTCIAVLRGYVDRKKISTAQGLSTARLDS